MTKLCFWFASGPCLFVLLMGFSTPTPVEARCGKCKFPTVTRGGGETVVREDEDDDDPRDVPVERPDLTPGRTPPIVPTTDTPTDTPEDTPEDTPDGGGGGGGGEGAPPPDGEHPPGHGEKRHGKYSGYGLLDEDCEDCEERRRENLRAREIRDGSAGRAKSLLVNEPKSPLTVEKEVKQPMDIGKMGELIRQRREREAKRDQTLDQGDQ